jgi:hypothetical protein
MISGRRIIGTDQYGQLIFADDGVRQPPAPAATMTGPAGGWHGALPGHAVRTRGAALWVPQVAAGLAGAALAVWSVAVVLTHLGV